MNTIRKLRQQASNLAAELATVATDAMIHGSSLLLISKYLLHIAGKGLADPKIHKQACADAIKEWLSTDRNAIIWSKDESGEILKTALERIRAFEELQGLPVLKQALTEKINELAAERGVSSRS